MYILNIAAELAPIAKVGGLGDVLQGLSRELIKLDHRVETILPNHQIIDTAQLPGLTCIHENLEVSFAGRKVFNKVWKATVEDQLIYLIDPQGDDAFFQRDQVYGYPDDIERYTYFAKAALEFIQQSHLAPDVLHLHEWQAALAAPLYRDLYQGEARLHFTVHNMAYQGQCSPYDLDRVGLVGNDYLTPDRLQDDEVPTLLNLMKGAIVYADGVNTVSPTYAREVLEGIHHHGIEASVRRYARKFKGILNGIDTDYWNPKQDRHLPFHYSAENFEEKRRNKEQLQLEMGLDVSDKPLVASITRLAMQKGIPLIRRALIRTVEEGAQFILLGSPSTDRIRDEFLLLRDQYRNNPNVAIELGHDEGRAHHLYAAADMLVAPSLFEPCGLIQLVGMRYGTIPIVRKTGGFADTVFDIDSSDRPKDERNGFVFEEANSAGMDSALDRALLYFRDHREQWIEMAKRGMQVDVGWKRSAEEYVKAYSSDLKPNALPRSP
jgi:starch synthase